MGDRLFAGMGGFNWWFGTVEDSFDPLALGRVRVRIVGHHNIDINQLPTNALPFASVILPTNAATNGGVGKSYHLPVGTRVIGFFLDSDTRLQPAIFGIATGQHISSITYAVPPHNPPQHPNINPLLGTDTSHTEQSCPDGTLANVNTTNVTPVDYRGVAIDRSQFVYPCTGYVCDYYGSRHGKHHGCDLASIEPQSDAGSSHLAGRYRGGVGVPIFAIADGTVAYVFRHSQGQKQVPTQYDETGQGSRSFGNAIFLRHVIGGQTFLSGYCHLGSNQDAGEDSDSSGILISTTIGTQVSKGQQIGTMGRTHNFDTPTHCHFQIHFGAALEPGGINTMPPHIIFPKMQNTHTSILSYVNGTLDYKAIPPFTPNDMPFKALEQPV